MSEDALLSGINVLIVDDSPDELEILERRLTSWGSQVTRASDGSEARSLLKKNSYQIVISDLVMPHMNGWELTKWIRSNSETINLPIIAHTNVAANFDKEKALLCGVNYYISKPSKKLELKAAIEHLLKEPNYRQTS